MSIVKGERGTKKVQGSYTRNPIKCIITFRREETGWEKFIPQNHTIIMNKQNHPIKGENIMKLEDIKAGLKVRAKTKSVKPNSFPRFLKRFPKGITTITGKKWSEGVYVVDICGWHFLPEDLEISNEDKQLKLFQDVI